MIYSYAAIDALSSALSPPLDHSGDEGASTIDIIPGSASRSFDWYDLADDYSADSRGVDNSLELGPTTKRARLGRSTDKESTSMSVEGNTCEEATQATLMELDSPRRNKRKQAGYQSSPSTTEASLCPSFRRKKRGVVITVDPMMVDDVSMSNEVEALTNDGLNGPYWQVDITAVNRCGDMSGIEIDARRYVTRSVRKRSGDASSGTSETVDSAFVDKDGDLMMDEMDGIRVDDHVTQRLLTSSALDSSDDEGMSDDDLSVMSDITTNSNIYSGADSSNALLGGLDIGAVDVCAERLKRMSVLEDVSVMDVDDDAGSVVCERYLLRSNLVLAKNRFVYYTRAMAKRTRSGKRY